MRSTSYKYIRLPQHLVQCITAFVFKARDVYFFFSCTVIRFEKRNLVVVVFFLYNLQKLITNGVFLNIF